jgi:hypothetical protein
MSGNGGAAERGRPSLLILGALILASLAWYHFVLRRRAGGWAPRLEPYLPTRAKTGPIAGSGR